MPSLTHNHTDSSYSLFTFLYPLGAFSEAFLMFSTLPPLSKLPAIDSILPTINPLTMITRVVTTLPPSIKSRLVKTEFGRNLLWRMARAGIASTLKGKTEAQLKSWGGKELFTLACFFIWWPGEWAEAEFEISPLWLSPNV
jgi:very-long-chain (3R)-3-hydroxyacyl-CoA dehydratase